MEKNITETTVETKVEGKSSKVKEFTDGMKEKAKSFDWKGLGKKALIAVVGIAGGVALDRLVLSKEAGSEPDVVLTETVTYTSIDPIVESNDK